MDLPALADSTDDESPPHLLRPRRRRRHARPGRPAGRPSRCRTETVLPLVALILDGASWQEAAREVGVGRSSLYRWLAKSRAGDPRYAGLAEVLSVAGRTRDQ